VLHPHLGETYHGVVVAVKDGDATQGDVVIQEPAIEAPVSSASPLPLGRRVRLRLAEADPVTRTVRFALAEDG
jgi:hypothetical protein